MDKLQGIFSHSDRNTTLHYIGISREDEKKLYCVPSMALILLVKVQSRVFTAKCSEPQVGISNGMDGGSGVAKFPRLRTET